MAIDPSISLGIKPVQIADPLEQLGKVQNLIALRNQNAMAPLHQQAAQQQLQTGALENQQRQMEVDDQLKWRKVYSDAGGDPEKAMAEGAKAGISPKILLPFRESVMKLATEKANLSKTELDNHNTKNDQLNALLQPVIAEADPQKQAALWDQQVQRGVQSGAMTPQEAQQHPYPGSPEAVKQYADGLNTDKWVTSQASKITAQTKADADKRAADLQPFTLAEAKAKQDQIERENAARANPNDPTLQQAALTAQQRSDKAQKDRAFAEELRSHLSNEATSKVMASIAAGRLNLEQTVNGMKYGPGTQEYWVKQLQDNPDSIREMPPELRSSVGQGFTKATGLPLPTPAAGAAQTQEASSRTALDNANWLSNALKNPEIRANIGPIMGRLGNAEQAFGDAPNLSPEAKQIAQEFRTRARYFVLQEGKSLMGGRMPAKLMDELGSSSANVKMDPNVFMGALSGAAGAAQTALDNVERGRFGGKMRPNAMRSGPSSSGSSGGTPAINSQVEYDKLPKGASYMWNGEPHVKQ